MVFPDPELTDAAQDKRPKDGRVDASRHVPDLSTDHWRDDLVKVPVGILAVEEPERDGDRKPDEDGHRDYL